MQNFLGYSQNYERKRSMRELFLHLQKQTNKHRCYPSFSSSGFFIAILCQGLNFLKTFFFNVEFDPKSVN